MKVSTSRCIIIAWIFQGLIARELITVLYFLQLLKHVIDNGNNSVIRKH